MTLPIVKVKRWSPAAGESIPILAPRVAKELFNK